jgi:hypothetical protein
MCPLTTKERSMTTRKPSLRRRVTPLVVGAFLLVGLAGVPAAVRAGDCDGCCSNHHCPPPYVHCMERPPCIKFKCACPKPVCPPCDSEFWGYYPTCWRRWPAMFANCPDRNPPWVAVAPPGMPAGYSNSLLAPAPAAPTMPPATPPATAPAAPGRESSWQPPAAPARPGQWGPATAGRTVGSAYSPAGEPGLLLLPPGSSTTH